MGKKIMDDLERKKRIFFQLAIVLGVLGLFVTISIFTAASRSVSSSWRIILLAFFLDFTAIACCFCNLRKHPAETLYRISVFVRKNILIFVLCTVFVILAAFQFENIPRGDANYYYGRLMHGTERYDNTFPSFIKNFILAQHVTHGMCLFLVMGEMLFPRQVVGVYGVSLMITVISFLCFYGIISRLFIKTSNTTKAIGTAVLMFNPYILGLFTYINPDYFTCVFTVIMVYCYLKEFNILFIFFGIILVLTKEPGVIIYSVFIGAIALTTFFRYREANVLERAKGSFLSFRFLSDLVPPVIFLVFFVVSREITLTNSFLLSEEISLEAPTRDMFTLLSWNNDGMWCFGFKPDYILQWLITFFVSNSIWLTSLLCISGLAVYIYKLQKKRPIKLLSAENVPAFIGIIGLLAAYTVFTCLYLIEYCPRYVTVGGFCLSVFAFASVHVLFRKKIMRNIVLGLLALLFLMQTYINVDPYMHLRSFYVYTGKRFIFGAIYREVPAEWSGDSRNFNYEYCFYESMLKQILRQINPDADTIIVQAIATNVEINLCGLETSVYWNARTKKRTYDYKDPDSIYLKVSVLSSPDDVQKYIFPDTFYLLTVPSFDEYTPQFLKEFADFEYGVSDVYKAENTVGLMTVYKMSKDSGS
jgi:hypothetical protein